MAKIIATVTVPDESFNAQHYPDLENPTVQEMIEFDLNQVEEGYVGDTELIDNYLETPGSKIEFKVEVDK